MDHWTSHLRPDGTTFPPVTPDPPAPPGYVDPIPDLDAALAREAEDAAEDAAEVADDDGSPSSRGDTEPG